MPLKNKTNSKHEFNLLKVLYSHKKFNTGLLVWRVYFFAFRADRPTSAEQLALHSQLLHGFCALWVKGHVHMWPSTVQVQWSSWVLRLQPLISLMDFSIKATQCSVDTCSLHFIRRLYIFEPVPDPQHYCTLCACCPLSQVCDSDTVLDPACTIEMLKILEEDPMVGGVGGDVQVKNKRNDKYSEGTRVATERSLLHTIKVGLTH